jgi:hypothetical protein
VDFNPLERDELHSTKGKNKATGTGKGETERQMKEYWTDRLRRRPIGIALGVLLVLAVLIMSVWYMNNLNAYRLPAIGEIEAIRVTHLFDGFGRDSGPFAIEPSQCRALLEALSPNSLDREPCKWVVMCLMEVKVNPNRVLRVCLYKTGDESRAAFSVESSGEDRSGCRAYYRGGDQEQVVVQMGALWRKIVGDGKTDTAFDPGSLGDTESDMIRKRQSKKQ